MRSICNGTDEFRFSQRIMIFCISDNRRRRKHDIKFDAHSTVRVLCVFDSALPIAFNVSHDAKHLNEDDDSEATKTEKLFTN